MIAPLVLALLLLPCAGAAATRPSIEGDFPHHAFPDAEARLAAIWDFVKTLGGPDQGLPAPRIVFSPFDPLVQRPDWTRWQSEWLCNAPGQKLHPETKPLCGDPSAADAWISAHPAVKANFPFPKQFRAFHYDGTDRIQIDPETTFLAHYQNGPSGFKEDLIGYGWHVAGHEMLHYVLENRGVPPTTHHCVFVTPQADGKSYLERLDEFLVEKGWGSPALLYRFGLAAERSMNPCGS
jgi:hypothetical protein